MSLIRRFYAALGANVTSQAVTIGIQLASVPMFLSHWSLSQYGNWLILTAVPTYFALADVGFLGVTINKMTMLSAANDVERANVLFQTAIKLCIYALSISVFLSVAVAYFVNYEPLDEWQNKLALVLLVLCAIMAMSSGLIDAVFRCSGEFAIGTHVVNGARVIEWIGLACGLFIGRTFLAAAIGQFFGRLLALLLGWQFAKRRHSHLQWGIRKASRNEFKELIRPALSFMAFPIGNAISIQGMTLVVGHTLGPQFLAVFSTYRTVSRVLVQAVTVIGRSLWPEISRKFGSGDLATVLSLYKRGTAASIALSGTLCIALYFLGEIMLRVWTAGRIPYDRSLFELFLLATSVTSIWQMGMVVLSATNNHMKLSISYVTASLGAVAVSFVAVGPFGKNASMLGVIGFEITMVIMCLIHMRAFKSKYWSEK